MTPATLLLRQIHPNFVQAGRVTSQAFRPTPKDEGCLSVDNGDLITPLASLQRFTANPAYASAGIMAVSFSECEQQGFNVLADAIPYPEHCTIDFTPYSKKEIEQKAKVLRSLAQTRGWLCQNNVNGLFTS
jgi:hypothetical protein